MKKRILLIGGYGGVGKALTRLLLEKTDHIITIAGRNIKKAGDFAVTLPEGVPVFTRQLDARNKNQLGEAMADHDLAIVTATIPDAMQLLGEVAIETGTDMLDILVRADVVDQLKILSSGVEESNLIFITQAGFHPGMIAPMIKLSAREFEHCVSAEVSMVMDPVFESAESIHEIIHEVNRNPPQLLKQGKWRKATYMDMITSHFQAPFGKKECYPMGMLEVHHLQEDLNFQDLGVYVAGFGRYIDYFVFPLAMLIGYFSNHLSQKVAGNLIYNYTKGTTRLAPRVALKLETVGIRKGKKESKEMNLFHPDGFQLTAEAVMACLNQYHAGLIERPGIHLMGDVMDEFKLFEDLKNMGLQITHSH